MAAITNLGIDMSPLANPLNSGRISNVNSIGTGFSKPKDSSKLSVPDPVVTYGELYAAQMMRDAMLHVPDTAPSQQMNAPIISDEAYWKNAEKKSQEMMQNLTPEQKDMLAHIEDYIGKSKLELEESIERKEKPNGNNR